MSRYPWALANVSNSYQIADSVAGFAYAFGGTCIILFVMNLIPGLSLRASEEAEILGIDDAELGEFAVCISCGAWLCSSETDFPVYSMITLSSPARSFPRTIQHRNSLLKQAPHPDYMRMIVPRNPRFLDPRLLSEFFYPCFVVVVLFSVRVVFLVSSGAFGGVCSRDWHGTKCWLDWGAYFITNKKLRRVSQYNPVHILWVSVKLSQDITRNPYVEEDWWLYFFPQRFLYIESSSEHRITIIFHT